MTHEASSKDRSELIASSKKEVAPSSNSTDAYVPSRTIAHRIIYESIAAHSK
jgi:hypothetical protein